MSGGRGVEDEGEQDNAEGAAAEHGRGQQHEPVVKPGAPPQQQPAVLLGLLLLRQLLRLAAVPAQHSDGRKLNGVFGAFGDGTRDVVEGDRRAPRGVRC